MFANQNIFRIYKHVSKGHLKFWKNFSRLDIFSSGKHSKNFRNSGATLRNKLQREGEFYLLIRFVGEIFPPYICTHGPGEDPFEAVMCAVGAASQISECLWRMLFLIQNITCYLCRNLFEKIFVKRYTVWEIFVIILEKKLFSHTMGRCFEEEMYFLTRWEDVSKKKCITLQVLKVIS